MSKKKPTYEELQERLTRAELEINDLKKLHDITDSKEGGNELYKLNRTLKALSNSNQVMMHAVDESAYIENVCRIIVEDCGHAMVWIGFAEEDEGKTVRPAAYAGFDEGYIEKLNVTWADTERGRGPTGTAIRTGKPSVCRNMLTDPDFKPWREEAIKRGYMSSLVLPLSDSSKVLGAVNIYSVTPDAFSKDEIKLLAELANDLAYGIMTLRLRAANVRAEEKVKKSEKRFRSLAENAPDIIMRLGLDLRFMYVNPEIYCATGILPEEFIGKRNEEMGMPKYLCAIWEKTYLNALKTKNLQEIEFEFPGPLGTRMYNSRILPELADDGSVESFLSFSRDVTDEKKMKQELISTQNYLNKLLNYANAPIIVWNTEFRITKFNHAFERLTDYKANDVIGKDLSMLFPENNRMESLIRIKDTLTGEHWEVVEIPILTYNGEIRIVLWNSANIYAEDGKTLVATIAQGQDITERKIAENNLEFVASFPKENPYPVMRISSDGLLMFANEASRVLLEAWNYQHGEPLPKDICEHASLALTTGRNLEIELPIGIQIFLVTFAPIIKAGYVNIYAFEITNRKLAEEELLRVKDELEERVRSRTIQLRALAIELTQAEHRERKRLAGALHDNLQQLLVGAKWGIQAAQKKARNKVLKESLNRTAGLLEESIKASKSLVVELSPPILYESGLVAALRWLVLWMKEKQNLAVKIDSEIEIEPDPDGVCVLLFQSVRELLLNVIKHSQVKEAQISIGRNDDNIQIIVSDKGAGFDSAKKANDQDLEAGFGLFSIRERLDILGGHMSVESSPGLGTIVSMIVPQPRSVTYKHEMVNNPALRVQIEKMKTGAAEHPGPNIRVLVADDHKIMREGLCGMLSSAPDIEVVGEAFDGENAVELAKELRPHIVIMDLNMPRLNGIEATRRIKSEAPGVKVIGLSMFEEEERASAMLKAGAVDYLHKAGPAQDLINSIRAHYSAF